jgi:restriction endonuclease-like protein
MTSSIPSVIEQQTRWARSKGFEPKNAFMISLADNLRQQLSDGALRDFEKGSAGALRQRGIRPAKMNALRSSAALSVNVFDYWRSHDPAPLRQALELRDKITRISFEEHVSTGLKGNPPNLDVLLTLEGNSYVAIASKFTEWLTPRDRTLDPKYFPDGQDLWTLQNLPNCQSLATGYRELGPFKHLDAPQLLKHALGLSRKGGEHELYYIYFDWDCPEGKLHAQELASFESMVGKEIGFRAFTYQHLFERLESTIRPADTGYLDYLRLRYSAR